MLSQQFTPVFLGTAYRNKGVQPLLDDRSLPAQPGRGRNEAMAHNDPNHEIALEADPSKPTVAMAFKIVEDPYGA